jgi:hypothetical protein
MPISMDLTNGLPKTKAIVCIPAQIPKTGFCTVSNQLNLSVWLSVRLSLSAVPDKTTLLHSPKSSPETSE